MENVNSVRCLDAVGKESRCNMQFDSYEKDLYVLPENETEKEKIINVLKTNSIVYYNSFSNVKGQAWYGKQFIEIPFGTWLKGELCTI